MCAYIHYLNVGSETNKRVDQLVRVYSNLTKVFGSRLKNATALNSCWESFAAPMVLLDSNLN